MILDESYTLSNGVTISKLGLGTWMIDDRLPHAHWREAIAMVVEGKAADFRRVHRWSFGLTGRFHLSWAAATTNRSVRQAVANPSCKTPDREGAIGQNRRERAAHSRNRLVR